MSKFKLSVLTLTLAAAGVCPWAHAMQQTSPASTQVSPASNADDNSKQTEATSKEQIEVIEVRSFAGSLIKSLNLKRFNDTVSETISADDLGALPDVSMADALTRLPGVSAVRTGGQASEINIRGMEGGFVFSTLNGREQVSTSGKRNIEFDQYPSELIQSAAVYKSPKASLIEGGVAGSVELQTASPLNAREQHNVVVNARGSYNDRANEVSDATEFGDRFSLSYQGKYLDDTLGLALGYARLFQPSVATQFVGFQYTDELDLDGVKGDSAQELVSEGFELQHRGGEETRHGYVAVLEWAPDDKLKVKADAFLSKFDTEAFARGFRVKFKGPTAIITNPVIVDNVMVGGTIQRKSSNSDTLVEMVNDDNTDLDEVRSFGLNTAYQLTDNLNLSLDIAHSSSKSNFRNGLLWSLVAQDATAAKPVLDPNVSITYQLNGLNLPGVGFNQAAAFTDINRMMVSQYGIYPTINSDEVDAYRLDGQYKLDNPIIGSIEAGVRYSERDYTNDRQVFVYGADNQFLSSEPPLRLTADMVKKVDFKGDFAAFPSYLAIDMQKALQAWFPNGVPQPVQTWGNGYTGLPDSQRVNGGKQTPWSLFESGDVFEDVLAAYLQANIDTEVFGLGLTGNIGVRMVETKQFATNMTFVDGDPTQGAQYITDEVGLVSDDYALGLVGMKYRDYLPQLNLNLALTDSDQLRFAAGRVMSRPPIHQLSAQTSFNIANNGDVSGSADKSPFLKPFYADQFDLSYEKYFTETEGAFVAALFYKNIKSFIQRDTIADFDFAAAGFPLPAYVPGTEPGNPDGLPPRTPDPIGTYNTAVNNDEGGYIRGAELAFTQVFKFLPSYWSGLGVSASYSYTESEISTEVMNGKQSFKADLKGLSPNVYTVTLFYEYGPFETRFSTRFRDDFISDQSAEKDQEVRYDAEMVMDYQASYQVNDNLGLLFQINNLMDEPTKSYWGQQAYTGTIQYFGRQFYLGGNYTF